MVRAKRSISLSCNSPIHKSGQQQAMDEIKFRDAASDFDRAKLTSNKSGNYPVIQGIADPNPQTDTVEKAIVDPRIKRICRYTKRNKWNPSANAVCTSKKIT